MLVTAVIPTYQCGPFIVEAIESALAQTYPMHQIIVVDDGSTDDTEAVVAPFLNRITYVRTPRQGVGPARNVGLDKATGDLVAFLDGDDAWHPGKTERQVKAFEAQPSLVGIATDFDRTDIEGRIMMASAIKTEYPVFQAYGLDWQTIFPQKTTVAGASLYYGPCFSSLFCGNFIKTSTLMVRRGPERYPGGLKTQEDYRYFLDLALAGPLGHLDASTLAYRRRPGQISDRAHARRIAEDSTDAVVDYLNQAHKLVAPELVRRRLADRYTQTGITRLAAEERPGAREMFGKAISTEFNAYRVALYASTWVPAGIMNRLRRALRG